MFSDIGHIRYYLLYIYISGNGYIYVNQDLTSEYSYVFNDIVLCIADRRDSGICITMTITLSMFHYVLNFNESGLDTLKAVNRCLQERLLDLISYFALLHTNAF